MFKSFFDFFFLIAPENISVPDEELSKWDKALSADKRTKQYAIERICHYRDRYAPIVEQANQRIGFLEDSKPVV